MDTVTSFLDELMFDYEIKGDEAFATCPFHHDSGDSWSVNIKTGMHHCFACNFSGNLAHLISYVLGLSQAEAVAWVLSRTGMSKAKQWLEAKGSQPPVELSLTDADLALFIPPPSFALESRRISAQAAARYEVLWNPKRNSWIFPIRDARNHKLMGWQEKYGRTFRNYPVRCRKSETLFGIGTADHGGTVILVESPVDSVRCLSARAGTGLSSFGVSVSNSQLSLIHSVADRLVLALDNDSYGMAETDRICRSFKQLPVYVFDYGMNKVKDIGEMSDEQIRWGVKHAISSIYFR